MSEANKIEETEEVKEINPVDEYLNNYKEQKLAEFCVQKDGEIKRLKDTLKDTIEERNELREKTEKYDKTWNNISELYSEIKKLSVDEYLELYHMILIDISEHNRTSRAITATTISSGLVGSTTRVSNY